MYKNAREHEMMPPLYFFIKILKENIYPFLLYFDKLYIKATEKNKF